MGYTLDKNQQSIVEDNHQNLLVIAGAGSGKTMTILGKIKYLIEEQNYQEEDILCITFTNMAAKSLKEKFTKEDLSKVKSYTFHKLALEILKQEKTRNIAPENILNEIIHEFFVETIFSSKYHMKIVLKYFKQSHHKEIEKEYQQFIMVEKEKLDNLERVISNFLHLLKCNNFTLQDFFYFLKQIRKTLSYEKYKREKIFLILVLNIYLKYQYYLKENEELDFDDLIIEATKHIKEKGVKQKIKFIIIDEYQDTSYIRFLLIQEIIKKTNAKFMVVGDDFQSIYQFTGCNLSLFLDFKRYFPNAKIKKIENTYRNSQELIDIAGHFVMKNRKQVKKKLHSNKHRENPIKIIYYTDIKKEFEKILEKLQKLENQEIFVLGRNNCDVNLILNSNIQLKENGILIYKKNTQLKIRYLTVHKAKGLEADQVMIINLENKRLGFPTQIKDDQILRLVNPIVEKYPYYEERRLFYVALTRTKNDVYLFVPRKNPSIFIEEIHK